MAHGGMVRIYRALRPAIDVALSVAHADELQIIHTGHSLGAALAQFMFLDTIFLDDCITFESPRFCDPTLAALLWSRGAIRVVNIGDIVPDVPTDPPFRHGGYSVHVPGPCSRFDSRIAHALISVRAGLMQTPPDNP